jgi:hypothetical protein
LSFFQGFPGSILSPAKQQSNERFEIIAERTRC